jgi:hypothetical protein
MSSSYNNSKRIGFGGLDLLDLTNDPSGEVTPLPDRPTRSNFNYTVNKVLILLYLDYNFSSFPLRVFLNLLYC